MRTFITQNNSAEVLLKLDVKNAFNSVERDSLCQVILDKIPKLYPYLWQCYSNPSKLFFNGQSIESCVGCQQGDPLGPALFSLAIHPIIEKLNSQLNVWFLDDGILAGPKQNVLDDLASVIQEFQKIGLCLNSSKCELYLCSSLSSKLHNETRTDFNKLAPNIRIISAKDLSFLGAPLLETEMPFFFKSLLDKFKLLTNNIVNINPHMALYILRHCFWIPKFNYYMRCCPLWKFDTLCDSFDNAIKVVLENIINIKFTTSSWHQATLPVVFGGLGIRAVSDISLPAFLSSIHAYSTLINSILSPASNDFEIEYLKEATNSWLGKFPNSQIPKLPIFQKSWDILFVQQKYDSLFIDINPREKAVLLAVSNKESGAWLDALPSPQLGTLLDKQSLQIAISLRLRSFICHPHTCVCGSEVDKFGHHGLSCAKNAGRIFRHSCLNDIIKRALNAAEISCILEPPGLFRDDGKRPDGITIIPWQKGQCLVWDVTCADTMAPCHLDGTSRTAGFAANKAEISKHNKYKSIKLSHIFYAFAVETLGPWSGDALRLFNEIGNLLISRTGIPKAKSFLRQRISIAIQKGNAASVLGTVPSSSGLEEVFLLL